MNLLTCHFLGDRTLVSFRDFIYSDRHGAVVVDQYVNYDHLRGLIHRASLARAAGLTARPPLTGRRAESVLTPGRPARHLAAETAPGSRSPRSTKAPTRSSAWSWPASS
jgi:hypothetical protein